jgi:hypothetical protein
MTDTNDKKYEFTEEELKTKIHDALMWASDGTEWHAQGKKEESRPLIMGDVEDLEKIILIGLIDVLPDAEDPAAPATAPATAAP